MNRVERRKPVDLGNRIQFIDVCDLGMFGRTGSYVLQEEQLTIIETSASPSIPYLLKGLHDLGIDPKDIQYIIVTHIHLDHAGGVGLLLQDCPKATVVVHPKGARHLAHPERLIEGARAVYGDKFDALYDPIVPVPEERIIVKADGETLTIGPDCTLQFYDTPGHANHHFSIYHPPSNGIFTGDTIGVYYAELKALGVDLYLASTSPNQFNPDAMKNSMERIREMGVDRIYFGHFGMSTDTVEVYRQIDYWLPRFVETARQVVQEGKGAEEISARLFQQVQQHLSERHVPVDHPVYSIIKLDTDVCGMGLAHYFAALQKKSAQ